MNHFFYFFFFVFATTWSVGRTARPERVVAMAARGAAEVRLAPEDGRVIEDTITLMVHWRNSDGSEAGAKNIREHFLFLFFLLNI